MYNFAPDKKAEAFTYKNQGKYNVDAIAEKLKQFGDEWFLDTTRQKEYAVHTLTNSYFIYEHSNKWTYGLPYNVEYRCADDKLFALVEPIIKDLEKIHNGKVAKCLFIKLPIGKVVYEHSDVGDYFNAVRRHHIAIQTNPDTFFRIDGEKKNMLVGDCWEINNMKLHFVENNGDTDRIHLLIDIFPNDIFATA
jgi:hypothetical protein